MSGNDNDNLPEGSQDQIVRNLRGRSVRLPAQPINNGGMGLQGNGQSTSGSLPHAQTVEPHQLHHQSISGGLAAPQTTAGLGLDFQGMYNSTHNHTISNNLAFSDVLQPMSGFSQQQVYSQTNNLFSVPDSAFPIVTPRGRVFHGYTFKDLKIRFESPTLTDARLLEARVLGALEALLANPPVLPENTVEEMNPKQVFPDYIKLEDDASKAEQLAAEKINNEIATESQKVDRERNNEAAKRSRRLKNENLDNANKRLVENALHIAWLEAQLSAMGGRPEAFDTIDPNVKRRLHGKIIESRDEFYEQRKRDKSTRDTKKRSEHNKKRALQKRELNERAARQCAEADQAENVEDVIEVASSASPDEAVIPPASGLAEAVIAPASGLAEAVIAPASGLAEAVIPPASGLAEAVIAPASGLAHPGPEQPQSEGHDQDQGQGDEANDATLADDADLDGSFMLMENDNEWDPCLA
ncbi:hypothetical protein C2857_004128 [Epichloe festucae Fl1]|uniref:Uncharacterized protein n=1 Tax=Epichloe festucae (strain Fl1) TaxID=877507 RepID=A0A7U3Q0J3_EPIFF|nr:hypothetical protein C2857_004128 [Epichloe festucae Fl1]